MYNENDPKAAAWLRELIQQKHLSGGPVDERSITELVAADCPSTSHFFAGIGGWSLALQLAGWPTDRDVWTGSCPCQPFSVAGKGKGAKDERHLWPDWFRLIRECRPRTIFGEQVPNAIGHGWLDGVFADLEGEGYACGAVVLGAHSVGAPHIRQRIYWVADSKRERIWGQQPGEDVGTKGGMQGTHRERKRLRTDVGACGEFGGLAHSTADGRQQECADGRRGVEGSGAEGRATGFGLCSSPGGVGNANDQGSQGQQQCGNRVSQWVTGTTGLGSWDAFDLIPCADGKSRRIESGTFPLAHGVPARVGRLRGYGNAIVPEVAATFVRAFLDSECA